MYLLSPTSLNFIFTIWWHFRTWLWSQTICQLAIAIIMMHKNRLHPKLSISKHFSIYLAIESELSDLGWAHLGLFTCWDGEGMLAVSSSSWPWLEQLGPWTWTSQAVFFSWPLSNTSKNMKGLLSPRLRIHQDFHRIPFIRVMWPNPEACPLAPLSHSSHHHSRTLKSYMTKGVSIRMKIGPLMQSFDHTACL